MKKRLLFIFFIIKTCTEGLFAQTVTNNLVAYYSFNRDPQKDSTRILDGSKNKNHGTVMGNTEYTTDRFGVPCSAFWFDGSSYISVPNSSSLNKPSDELSIAVWFKLAKGADFFKQWITICCKGDRSREADNCPHFRMQATAQTISINTEFTERVIPQLKYDVWYFYAYTYDGNKVKAFLDGKLFFEMDFSSPLSPNDMPLDIGRDVPGALEYFFGAMDDLYIFDRALSNAELSSIFNDQSGKNAPNRCQMTVSAPPTTRPNSKPEPETNPNPTSNPTPEPEPNPVPQSDPKPQSDPETSTKPNPTPSPQTKPDPETTPKPQPTPSPQPDPKPSYDGLPTTIENEPVKYQKIVEVGSREVNFHIYDNEKEDGDIVSININGVWVREQYELKNKKSPPPKSALIKCLLQPGDQNYFISKAWNLGTIPPNTLTVEISDGITTQKVVINSEVGLSGGIRIVCKG